MHTQTLMGIFLIFVHIIIITSFYYLQGKYITNININIKSKNIGTIQISIDVCLPVIGSNL